MGMTEVYMGTDEQCEKCELEGRDNPDELTYVHGLEEPGVYGLICAKHGTIEVD